MHTCPTFLQGRLRSATQIPRTEAFHRRLHIAKASISCRRKLQISARASTQGKQEVQKEEAHAVSSIEEARESFTSLFGEGSAALDVVSQAESAVEEGSLEESYLDSIVALANDLGNLTTKSGSEATAKVDEADQKAKAANDKYLRLNADFDNFRKRSGLERDQLGDRTRGEVIKGLIPLVDSFEAAQTSVSAETENEKKINGAYQGLYKQMVEVFKGLGVEAVPGVGQPFDPNVHEAIMREPNETMPDGTVLQEFRRGFRLGKTLLRPGMVKVSYSEAPAQPAENGAEAEAEKPAIDIEVEEARQ